MDGYEYKDLGKNLGTIENSGAILFDHLEILIKAIEFVYDSIILNEQEIKKLIEDLKGLVEKLDLDKWQKSGKGRKARTFKLQVRELLKEVTRNVKVKKDPVIKMLSYFIRGRSRKPDVYKLRLLWCLVKKCDQAYKAFEKLKEVVEIVSAHPDSIDERIKKPMSNPINEELEIEGERYKMAGWFLFLLHLAGFKTDLSSLWENIRIYGKKAVRRLNEIFEEIYGDRVSQVKKETAVQIKEILIKKWAVKTRKRSAGKTWSKKKRNISPPILVTPLMGSDPMLTIKLEKEGNLIKGEAGFLPWNVRDISKGLWILRWVGGGWNVNDILEEQMLEAGYVKVDVGEGTKWKFIWEMYLEDVERYFNFAPGWNKFLKEIMELLTLWRRYLIFVNLYLVWILWGHISPSQMDNETKEIIIKFLGKWLSLRIWEVIVILIELWFDSKEIKGIIQKGHFLATSGENVKEVYNFLKRELWEEAGKYVMSKNPSLLSFSTDTIRKKMDLLKKMLWEEEAKRLVSEYPLFLMISIRMLSSCKEEENPERCFKGIAHNIINYAKTI